jgi:hypothetical protein
MTKNIDKMVARKIPVHTSIRVAKKVLSQVEQQLMMSPRELDIVHYSNCREQGYCLRFMPTGKTPQYFSFAESAGSDNIVVHAGFNFDLNGFIRPEEDEDAVSVLFQNGRFDLAAYFIVTAIALYKKCPARYVNDDVHFNEKATVTTKKQAHRHARLVNDLQSED